MNTEILHQNYGRWILKDCYGLLEKKKMEGDPVVENEQQREMGERTGKSFCKGGSY